MDRTRTSDDEEELTLEAVEAERDAAVLELRLSGRLDTARAGARWSEAVHRVHDADADRIVLDAEGVTYCDSAGAALVIELEDQAREAGRELELKGFPEEYRPVLDIVREASREDPPEAPPPPGFFETVGRIGAGGLQDVVLVVHGFGEIAAALAVGLARPRRMRLRDGWRTVQLSGAEAIPVVVGVTFLLGLILAYQTADRFRAYGAETYMVELLAFSLTRELGPLMTAILMTARTGSALAAEFGTMQVNEELDALEVMGLDPMRFLAAPRILGVVFVMPILTVISVIAGLTGGLLVWMFDLMLPFDLFVTLLADVIGVNDLLVGLSKALLFGLLVAAVSCLRGRQARGGADEVGRVTTSAVVSSIVMLAIADLVLTFVCYYLEI